MGETKLIEKVIDPTKISALSTTLTNLTPAQVTAGRAAGSLGYVPMGVYKGAAAFFDLDKLANQPLVSAEQQYVMGLLDGREANYDLLTLTIPITSPLATLVTGTLTVPAGELWYINAVQSFIPFDATAGVTVNWHCSLWTDRAAVPAAAGQPFRTAAVALANVGAAGTHTIPAGVNATCLDEFGQIATAWVITNKVPLLRLPAGTILTFTVLTDAGPAAAAIACTFSLFGAMARILVA